MTGYDRAQPDTIIHDRTGPHPTEQTPGTVRRSRMVAFGVRPVANGRFRSFLVVSGSSRSYPVASCRVRWRVIASGHVRSYAVVYGRVRSRGAAQQLLRRPFLRYGAHLADSAQLTGVVARYELFLTKRRTLFFRFTKRRPPRYLRGIQ